MLRVERCIESVEMCTETRKTHYHHIRKECLLSLRRPELAEGSKRTKYPQWHHPLTESANGLRKTTLRGRTRWFAYATFFHETSRDMPWHVPTKPRVNSHPKNQSCSCTDPYSNLWRILRQYSNKFLPPHHHQKRTHKCWHYYNWHCNRQGLLMLSG